MLRSRDTMNGSLIMGGIIGKRVTGLPTDAPTTESKTPSVAQMARVVTDTKTMLDRVL